MLLTVIDHPIDDDYFLPFFLLFLSPLLLERTRMKKVRREKDLKGNQCHCFHHLIHWVKCVHWRGWNCWNDHWVQEDDLVVVEGLLGSLLVQKDEELIQELIQEPSVVEWMESLSRNTTNWTSMDWLVTFAERLQNSLLRLTAPIQRLFVFSTLFWLIS